MTTESDQTEAPKAVTAEAKRTRELNPVTVATVTEFGNELAPIYTAEDQADANKWIRDNAQEGVTYTIYRELGKRITLKIETIRRFEEV
jgi:hypothetical protein